MAPPLLSGDMSRVTLVVLLFVAVTASAEEPDKYHLVPKTPDALDQMFTLQREHPQSYGLQGDKAKLLDARLQQLRLRAAALGERAEDLWDQGKYDKSEELMEQAGELGVEQRRTESELDAVEMGEPHSGADSAAIGDAP